MRTALRKLGGFEQPPSPLAETQLVLRLLSRFCVDQFACTGAHHPLHDFPRILTYVKNFVSASKVPRASRSQVCVPTLPVQVQEPFGNSNAHRVGSPWIHAPPCHRRSAAHADRPRHLHQAYRGCAPAADSAVHVRRHTGVFHRHRVPVLPPPKAPVDRDL